MLVVLATPKLVLDVAAFAKSLKLFAASNAPAADILVHERLAAPSVLST